jgi:hypothetical protein
VAPQARKIEKKPPTSPACGLHARDHVEVGDRAIPHPIHVYDLGSHQVEITRLTFQEYPQGGILRRILTQSRRRLYQRDKK